MNLVRFWRFFVLCCGALSAPAAAESPFSLTLDFVFFYNGVKAADVREVFSTDADGGYEIVSHAEATGLAKIFYGDIFRKSTGKIDRLDGLRMLQYEEKRGARDRTFAKVDAQSGVLHLQKGGEMRTEKLPDAPLADYLAALYRARILGGVPDGESAITNGWRIKIYEYEEGAPEIVKTTEGEVRAIPLIRESPRGRRVFWIAPSLDYLPVRSYINDKGHVFETVITKINGITVGD